MMKYWLSSWQTSLDMASSVLENVLIAQRSMIAFSAFNPLQPWDENRVRDAFQVAADVNLRQWEGAANVLQKRPNWLMEMERLPGTFATDFFDKQRRTALKKA